MERDKLPGASNRPPAATVMSITVREVPRVRGRPLGRVHIAVAIALALTALVAIIAVVAQGNRTGLPVRVGRAQVPDGERRAIAAALGYPYPLRCLTITISGSSADYARANVDRTNGCGRFRGYLNASLHRVNGAWRLVLDEGQLFVPNHLLAPRPDVRRH